VRKRPRWPSEYHLTRVSSRAHCSGRADPTFVPAGGESLAALGTRVRGVCEELLDEIREGDVVVVSHVSPIKAAIAWALSAGDEVAWKMFVEVASIARVGVDGYGPSLRSLNERLPTQK